MIISFSGIVPKREILVSDDLTARLAARLKHIRQERGWSLEQLASLSGVSRASLSRLENAETSPTTDVLGKLCAVYGFTQSRLLAMVEESFEPFVPFDRQTEWRDETIGFVRRVVSPPARSLNGEVIECALAPGAHVSYQQPSLEGLEHHLVMLAGRLSLRVDRASYELKAGDCLRYQLRGETEFSADPKDGARYYVVQIGGGALGGVSREV